MYTIAKNNPNESPIGPFIEQPPVGFKHFETVITQKVHTFYILKPIEDPELFIDMAHIIKNASPEETIMICLNSPGGHLDTTVQLINAMRASQARIITSIEGEAHSAATMIFLSGDEFVVHENTLMMFHNFSGGAFGKGNEMKLQVDAVVKWFNKMAHDIYYPFLTEKEINDLIAGKDFWMESDEIKDRLYKMVDKLQKKRASEERAAIKAQQLLEETKIQKKTKKTKVEDQPSE